MPKVLEIEKAENGTIVSHNGRKWVCNDTLQTLKRTVKVLHPEQKEDEVLRQILKQVTFKRFQEKGDESE